MVALIKTIKSLSGSFYYNERKLSSGDASCLIAENYPRQLSDLSQSDRLGMLEKMAALNPRTKVNGLHIFLNFDPANQLSPSLLKEIARFYMYGIGFGNQPYLVYEHFDAAHPHLHILTTNIRADGRRINLYMKSERFQSLLKQIRTRFALATGTTGAVLYPRQLSRLIYGKSQTFSGISRVLESILNEYLLTSFTELNAVLGLYNVRAEGGKEGSRLFKNRGLIYHLLDGSGNRIGVPIKASSLPFNPGLNRLEEKFKRNGPLKRGLEGRIICEIDLVLSSVKIYSAASFRSSLKTKAIDVVFKIDQENRLQEVIYVDHRNKCVFKGVDLASAYGAEGILGRLGDNVHRAMEFEKGQGVHAGDSQQGLPGDGLSALVNLSQIPHQQDHLSVSVVKTKRKQRGRKLAIKH
ncbi:relaxase/mobilization nuclease domain-containing protein [Pedobacter panaciterrae]|uniref:relaxase/mobilization nuclease domain-containing protein n=1 Tax=Pedobacter panaciterrae TaxID=363849 RepID=UPI0025985CF4|nr:relaxase/mobilization nuclease domain-containing protein [uncultured Pedobacter sp.]